MRKIKTDTPSHNDEELFSYFVNPQTARILKKISDDFDVEIQFGLLPRPDLSPREAMKMYRDAKKILSHSF